MTQSVLGLPNIEHQAKERLVTLAIQVWLGWGQNPQPPNPMAGELALELMGLDIRPVTS